MDVSIVDQIRTYFRNKTLNAVGAERDLYTLLRDGDVGKALDMMKARDTDIDNALSEYNPQLHKVMRRRNKWRKKGETYITEKLPRARQRYINEVELFFLLANPIRWNKRDGDDAAFRLFTDHIDHIRFNAKMRKAKRLAGAELESALAYHVYQENGRFKFDFFVVARSLGYKIRTLFDQYGNMMAFAYGYILERPGKTGHECWTIETKDWVFECKARALGWDVDVHPNPLGKIACAYFLQPKAWDGAEPRMEREELLDSKLGDTNNYFSDPIAKASADVINAMADPDKPGKLIQLTGSNSQFDYVTPPSDSATRLAEKGDLNDSILFDTFTPDFSLEKMRGLGTLSGAAIKNAMVLGYIKRENRLEVYEDGVDRFRSITIELLKLLHPESAAALDALEIDFEFQEPFDDDNQRKWSAITTLYSGGLISLETAVHMLALTDAPEEEVDRIRMAAMELEAAKAMEQESQDQKTEEP